MTIPIKYVVLESVDCGGKTTLYNNIHEKTWFKYNIHDRSFLSMLCYAVFYGRDSSEHDRQFKEEVCDLNNFVVVLLPQIDVVLERFRKRGDELQDETSLIVLHDLFTTEIERYRRLPNVLVVEEAMTPEQLSAHVAEALDGYERRSSKEIGQSLHVIPRISWNNEVQARLRLSLPPAYEDPSVMSDAREGNYYSSILSECEEVVRNEMNGINPYCEPQDETTSRRFYYNSDTCISSIHFLPRKNGTVDVLCTLRSTDAEKNGEIDLRFLSHVATHVPRKFCWKCSRVNLTVSFNSLHIRTDSQ